MFVLNGMRTELLNTEMVERFLIVEKPDACLIVASYNNERPPVTIARYTTISEAIESLGDLSRAISEEDQSYSMYASTGVNIKCNSRPQNGYHGKKRGSHGGS